MAARHRSRKRALQVLFEWDMRREEIDRAIQHYYDSLYSEEQEKQPKPDNFMEELARGTARRLRKSTAKSRARSANWRLERMAVVDRNILRLAIYELRRAEVPAVVIIDEALELARQFSNDESLSFINGVLDAIYKQAKVAGSS